MVSVLLGACGDDDGRRRDGPPADTSSPGDMFLAGDMSVPSDTPVPNDMSLAGDMPGESASLAGSVTRSATPRAGGDGDIYVAVFDRDPVLDMMNAVAVGNAFIEDADLSADGASVPYTVEAIEVRAEPYFLIAFLDDNDNVDASDMANAGPDSGDLLSLRGLSSVRVTLDTPGIHDLDIDLNSVLP